MTNAEADFQDAARELGCIACLVSGYPRADGDIHHILSGGRRISEMDVLCLCPAHHRTGGGHGRFISRHPWRTRFEAAYSTEKNLLAIIRRMVQERMAA